MNAAIPHVARKIKAITAAPPSTGTTARANGDRSLGGVTGEPGTVPARSGEGVGTAPSLAAGWSQSTGST